MPAKTPTKKKRKLKPTTDAPSDAGTIRRQTDPLAVLDKHTLSRTFIVSQDDANLVSAWWAQEKKVKENGGGKAATRAKTALLPKPSAPGEDQHQHLGPSFTMEVNTDKVLLFPLVPRERAAASACQSYFLFVGCPANQSPVPSYGRGWGIDQNGEFGKGNGPRQVLHREQRRV